MKAKTKYGMSPSGWRAIFFSSASLLIVIITGAIVYGGNIQKIGDNSNKIEKLEVTIETVRKEIKTDIKDMEGRLTDRMDRNGELQKDRYNEILDTIRNIK